MPGETVKPLVSVVIATHNRAHCLPHALHSVYAQEGLGDYFEIETIVVDDASSDATAETIRQFRDVRYIRLPERRGVSSAMNEGLRACSGSYIAFLDDDDVWLPHKLRVQVPLLTAHPDVGVVYGQSLQRYGAEERLIPDETRAPSGRVFMAMLMENFCGHHACLLVRRAAFEQAGYFDERLASYEDYDLSLRLAFHFPFLFMPGAVAVYNLSPQGLWLSRAATGHGTEDAVRVIEKALQMLPGTAQYGEVKREATARVALGAVYPFLYLNDLRQAWAKMMATLGEYPWIVRYDWARGIVQQVTSKRALAADAPVPVARELCAQIKAVTRKSGIRERAWTRQMFAGIWAEVARGLALGPPAHDRDAAFAAACALAHASVFSKRLGVVRLLVRGVLGRRAEAACVRLYTDLKWWLAWPRESAPKP